MTDSTKKRQIWRPPTRRTFLQLLGAAAAAMALRDKAEPSPPPPIWIGHF
jgi:hypothetical protein